MSETSEVTVDESVEAAAPTKRKGRLTLTRLVPRTWKTRLISAIAVLLVVGLGVWFFLLRPQPVSAPTTQTLTLSATTLKTTVSASGTLEPEREADLSFSSGTVTAVLVGIGDTVTAGQTLATIDPAALRIAYQSAIADLSAAQATLTTVEDSSSSTTAAIKVASATVQVKQNAVATAKANLATATMTAPFDGIVAQVNIATGDTTSSGGTASGAGTTSGSSSTKSSSSSAGIVVISKGTFTVSTTVSNTDVASIKRGLQAVITPTGATTAVYGTVSSVGVVATTSSGTSGSSTFPVTISVTGTHPELLAGSAVTVDIVTAQYTDVIAVPTQSLTTASGTTTVKKLVDGQEVATLVTTGAVVGSSTVITEGLSEGDQIVVANGRVAGGSSTARAGTARTAGQGGFSGAQASPGGVPVAQPTQSRTNG